MRPYPIDQVWQKGQYVARIDGPDPKYVVAREFLRGRGIKSRQTLEYAPDDIGTLPAWVIRTGQTDCGECGRPKPAALELIAAQAHGWEVIGTGFNSGQLLRVWEMGPPGSPNAWDGDRCADCGEPLAGDPDGTDIAERCANCARADQGREEAHALAGDKETPF